MTLLSLIAVFRRSRQGGERMSWVAALYQPLHSPQIPIPAFGGLEVSIVQPQSSGC